MRPLVEVLVWTFFVRPSSTIATAATHVPARTRGCSWPSVVGALLVFSGFRTGATYYKVSGPNGNFHGAPGSDVIYTNVMRDFSLIRVTAAIEIRLSRSSGVRP